MNKVIWYISFCFIIIIYYGCKKSDKESPVITINGDKNISINLNSEYTDPGATAYDAQDGELSVDISDTVNVNLAGTYYISYTASDASGNSSSITRVVKVKNSSEIHIGNYSTETQFLNDTVFLTSVIQISTTLNNRLWINGFSKYSDASVFIDLTSDSIVNIPSQTIFVNSDLKYHGYKGTGIIKLNSSPRKIIINFSDSTATETINGKSILINN